MHFLHPIFLPLVLLAALPVLVHLIGRPHAKVMRFAALELLLRSQKQTSKWLRLRERLLMLARTLAILAIPLLLARPYLVKENELAHLGGRQSAVIIVDDSLSMSYIISSGATVGKKTTLLDRAKSQARDLIEGFHGDSEAAVLRGSKGQSGGELTSDIPEVRHQLDRIEPTYRSSDLAGAVARALSALQNATIDDRRIYIFSDFTQRELGGLQVPEGIALIPLDVAEGMKLKNHSVERLSVTLEDAHTVDIVVEVGNYSDEPLKDFPVTVKRGQKELIAKGLIDVAPRSTAEKHFSHVLGENEEGLLEWSAELDEGSDALPLDDRKTAALSAQGPLRTLIVDGDLRAVRRESGSFFLETALKTPRPGSPIQVEVAEPNEVGKLADYDVVFLSNVKTIPPGLAEFVRQGGGLFVALGNQIDDKTGDAYNASGLLPEDIASIKKSASPLEISVEKTAWGLETSAAGAKVEQHAMYRPSGKHGDVLWRLSDGTPLLIGSPIDSDEDANQRRGRVLLFGSSLDNEWNDVPLLPTFLPIVHTVTQLLANRSGAPPATVEPGQPKTVPAGEIEVRTPAGKKTVIVEEVFRNTDLPGVYRVLRGGRERAELSFVVNPSVSESDLTKAADIKKIAKLPSTNEGNKLGQAPLWHLLATALLLFLLIEALLMQRRISSPGSSSELMENIRNLRVSGQLPK